MFVMRERLYAHPVWSNESSEHQEFAWNIWFQSNTSIYYSQIMHIATCFDSESSSGDLLNHILDTSSTVHILGSQKSLHLQIEVKLLQYYCLNVLYTGLFEMIVGVLTTCHTQYTWDYRVDVCRITKGARIEHL